MPAYIHHHDAEPPFIICPSCVGLPMCVKDVAPHWSMAKIDFTYECSISENKTAIGRLFLRNLPVRLPAYAGDGRYAALCEREVLCVRARCAPADIHVCVSSMAPNRETLFEAAKTFLSEVSKHRGRTPPRATDHEKLVRASRSPLPRRSVSASAQFGAWV
jgi:hypothetical protein